MKLYRLYRVQHFNVPIEDIWSYFSSPENLNEITPPYMKFVIKSQYPGEIYPGLLIEYKVRPVLNIPTTWVSEITHVKRPFFFIDQQIFGPYTYWHHEHHFNPTENGTEVIDLVHYKLPFGFIGRFLHWLFVKKQLNAIFDYRREALSEIFSENVYEGQPMQ